MPLPLAATAKIAGYALLNAGINYLLREIFPNGNESQNYDPIPYVPPFVGGQCEGSNYAVEIAWRDNSRGVDVYVPFGGQNRSGSTEKSAESTILLQSANVVGSISGISSQINLGGNIWRVNINGVSVDVFASDKGSDIRIDRVVLRNGEDNCGNLPNPNPVAPPPENGLSNPNYPNFNESERISEGLAPLALPKLSALLAAALAALDLANSIGDLANAIKDALAALADFLDSQKEEEDKKEKKENISIVQYNFGRVSRDGFFNLYPQETEGEIELLYLEIDVQNIPRGRGRVFGAKSPNYFPFEPLGRIAFCTPTYGIISNHQIEYGRSALPCDKSANGFYYHFGLNGRIAANIVGFYQLTEQVQEQL